MATNHLGNQRVLPGDGFDAPHEVVPGVQSDHVATTPTPDCTLVVDATRDGSFVSVDMIQDLGDNVRLG